MLDFDKLHDQFRKIATLVELPMDADFDSNIAGEAFIIESGYYKKAERRDLEK